MPLTYFCTRNYRALFNFKLQRARLFSFNFKRPTDNIANLPIIECCALIAKLKSDIEFLRVTIGITLSGDHFAYNYFLLDAVCSKSKMQGSDELRTANLITWLMRKNRHLKKTKTTKKHTQSTTTHRKTISHMVDNNYL